MSGTIFGKEIKTFDPGVSCDERDVIHFLGNISQIQMLRKISDLDTNIEMQTGLIHYDDIPVNSPLLVEAAEYAVRYCDSSKDADVSDRTFSVFLRMVFKARDNRLLKNNDSAFSLLVRIANRDFPTQENMLSELVLTPVKDSTSPVQRFQPSRRSYDSSSDSWISRFSLNEFHCFSDSVG